MSDSNIGKKYSTPDNWRAIIIRLKSVVRRLVSTDVLEISLLPIPVPRSHASILYPFCPQAISDERYRIGMTLAYEYISVSRPSLVFPSAQEFLYLPHILRYGLV